MTVNLPYKYTPRVNQLPFWKAMDSGIKRAALVWHRREGKDKTAFNYITREAYKKPGTYLHMLPYLTQARTVIWDGRGADGLKFTDHIPSQIIADSNKSGSRKKINNTEMKVELINGSLIKLAGADSYNSIVGSNMLGLVLSEYSIQNPAAWEFLRPILTENGGFAIFAYTPRGRNHGYRLFHNAINNPKWYASRLTVEDTGDISLEDIDEERKMGMSEEMIQQEFYCSFEGVMEGAYYGKQMSEARAEGRIPDRLPLEKSLPVHTWWDLGMDDSTSIWFVQKVNNRELRFVDYYANSGEGFGHYAGVLAAKALERGYFYGKHIAPHDIKVREMGPGKDRISSAYEVGIKFELAPPSHQVGLMDGIEAVRRVLPKCWFDATRCAVGLDSLEGYHKEYDETNKVFRMTPKHDWASHGSDAFRTGAIGEDILDITIDIHKRTGGGLDTLPEYNPLVGETSRTGQATYQ